MRTRARRFLIKTALPVGVIAFGILMVVALVFQRARVDAVVFDEAGKPVVGVDVQLQSLGPGGYSVDVHKTKDGVGFRRLPHRSETTDERGRVSFSFVATGTYMLIVAPPAEMSLVRYSGSPVVVKRRMTYTEHIVMFRSAAIAGTVLDGAGKPPKDTAVMWTRLDDPSDSPESAKRTRGLLKIVEGFELGTADYAPVDESGAYEFRHNLPAGRYVLVASPWCGSGLGPGIVEVELDAGKETRADFTLRPSVVLEGSVRISGDDGKGVPNANVILDLDPGGVRAIGRTSVDGSFKISDGLARGTWKMFVTDPVGDGFLLRDKTVEITQDVNHIDLVVGEPSRLLEAGSE